MKLLSFESSAKSASVSLTDGTMLVAQSFQNCGFTHSRTLLPMTEQLLDACAVSIADIDAFAIAAGPGSFTGVRIGVATVKGLALGQNKPCVGVSTLEAMARGVCGMQGIVNCVMDARAGQVYHARFRVDFGTVERLCEDRAITIVDLGAEIGNCDEILVGDGAQLCYNTLTQTCMALRLAPPHLRYPTAYGVAMAALPIAQNGQWVDAQTLDAIYLRKPQAERKRKNEGE